MPLLSFSYAPCASRGVGGALSRTDLSHLIQTPPAAVAISGRLLADVRRFPSGCSGLLEVDRIEARGVEGRTELQLPNGQETRSRAGPRPSGLGAAFGSFGHRRAGLLASAAHHVEAPQQVQAPIAVGQVIRSDGLSVQRLQPRSGALVMRVGYQRRQLFPIPQALWAPQHQQRSEPLQMITETWLGFKPSAPQRRWFLKHGAGAWFVCL